uniref:Uncharacterized protein n=1 Tax=Spongospora subterranea TaxID=70186 RepID=A0A0H5QSR0_9EUKA|eukprot:CRZ04616.1 hypothetical protein [Spongospora subterranea]
MSMVDYTTNATYSAIILQALRTQSILELHSQIYWLHGAQVQAVLKYRADVFRTAFLNHSFVDVLTPTMDSSVPLSTKTAKNGATLTVLKVSMILFLFTIPGHQPLIACKNKLLKMFRITFLVKRIQISWWRLHLPTAFHIEFRSNQRSALIKPEKMPLRL